MTATEPGRDEMISIVMKQASYITRGMACKIVDAILPRLSTPADQAVREATIEAVDFSFDLRETLKAVLEFWGVDGAAKVTRHVMMARRSRDSNVEIDRLEECLSTTEPKRS